MLRERNIYLVSDPVYLERQKALRVMEHKIEGRLFRPALRAGGMSNKDWKRLWSRLSKVLLRVQPPTPVSSRADDSDSNNNLSGFSTMRKPITSRGSSSKRASLTRSGQNTKAKVTDNARKSWRT
ncbi:hypothetical protein B0T26DRAFT_478570 [Lasiosphaeria miniovina]|uniref:Uncharacterized protein n=1 Tax=Lasiosphaeria miniovina TaxID=1954250 RepID=A0AA40A091_9PEZI|nr:uncharacterized protein B0T26DRAFT_478570 [Lasiosphaeria miniovina]KAK0706888.1 hypothetical protein B0T26DRAFT_478570 [Lasiosphaeria miniovina]